MAVVVYFPSTLKEGFFTDLPAPTAGDDAKAITYDHDTQAFVYAAASGGTPPGSDTQVIINDGGVYGADPGLTYAKATDRLTVAGGLVAPSMRPASDGTEAIQFRSASNNLVAWIDTTNSYLITVGTLGIGGAVTNGLSRDGTTGETIINSSTAAFSAKSFGTTFFRATNALLSIQRLEVQNSSAFYTPAFTQYGSVIGGSTITVPSSSSTLANIVFMQNTINNSSGAAVTDAANIYVENAPRAHPFGGGAITGNKWAIWVDDGSVRLDGNVVIGGTAEPSNALEVVGTVQADGLRLDVTPTAETPTMTHTITISLNGTDYKIPCVAA